MKDFYGLGGVKLGVERSYINGQEEPWLGVMDCDLRGVWSVFLLAFVRWEDHFIDV